MYDKEKNCADKIVSYQTILFMCNFIIEYTLVFRIEVHVRLLFSGEKFHPVRCYSGTVRLLIWTISKIERGISLEFCMYLIPNT